MTSIQAGDTNRPTPSPRNEGNFKVVDGYGLPKGEYYPYIDRVVAKEEDKTARYSREDIKNCECCVHGYLFYVIGNAVFARDISGYFYKLNNETKQFEWFADGWLEDNEFTTGLTLPCAPTYISFNKDRIPIFPTNDDSPPKPVLPKNEAGECLFPVDPDNKTPLFPVDFYGVPCFPVGDDGKPQFPMDSQGRPLVPIGVDGIAIFPKDANGNAVYPQGPDGRPIPPVTVFGNPVAAINNGVLDVPYDVTGQPLIIMGGEGNKIPMTEEQYQAWMYQSGGIAQGVDAEKHSYDVAMMEMSQNESHLQGYLQNYYQDYGVPSPQDYAQYPPHPPAERQKTAEEIESEKRKKKLGLALKSMKKTAAAAKEQLKVEVVPQIPANRPPLPNKEKERGERYIPEQLVRRQDKGKMSDNKNRRDRGYRRESRERSGGFRNRRKVSRSRSPIRDRPMRRRRTRSRSRTYSPDRNRRERRRVSRSRTRSSSRSSRSSRVSRSPSSDSSVDNRRRHNRQNEKKKESKRSEKRNEKRRKSEGGERSKRRRRRSTSESESNEEEEEEESSSERRERESESGESCVEEEEEEEDEDEDEEETDEDSDLISNKSPETSSESEEEEEGILPKAYRIRGESLEKESVNLDDIALPPMTREEERRLNVLIGRREQREEEESLERQVSRSPTITISSETDRSRSNTPKMEDNEELQRYSGRSSHTVARNDDKTPERPMEEVEDLENERPTTPVNRSRINYEEMEIMASPSPSSRNTRNYWQVKWLEQDTSEERRQYEEEAIRLFGTEDGRLDLSRPLRPKPLAQAQNIHQGPSSNDNERIEEARRKKEDEKRLYQKNREERRKRRRSEDESDEDRSSSRKQEHSRKRSRSRSQRRRRSRRLAEDEEKEKTPNRRNDLSEIYKRLEGDKNNDQNEEAKNIVYYIPVGKFNPRGNAMRAVSYKEALKYFEDTSQKAGRWAQEFNRKLQERRRS